MIRKTLHILREDGPLVVRRRAARFAQRRLAPKHEIALPVAMQDILEADWENRKANDGRTAIVSPKRLTVNWVIPPIANGSGGHHTILRFVRALEARGHVCNIIIYDGREIQSAEEARVIIRRHFPDMGANVWVGREKMNACDALIATAWQTAYPVFNAPTTAMKFYFVQDYEPLFFPVGTESVLAENTYKFGLHGITAGRWLSHKLAADFGMRCDHFEFGSDSGRYLFNNGGRRDRVIFYARPGAPRRGFELGVFALALFARENPDYEIHMFGSDVRDYRLPFNFTSHGVLKSEQLNELYNEAAAALVMSLTNMSLLPLELLSAGCIPVVNNGENNRLVSDNPYIAYADPSPRTLAQRLQDSVSRADLPQYAKAAADSVQMLSWDASAIGFEEVLLRCLATGSHLNGPSPDRNGAHPVSSLRPANA
jgi:glycosyltransferase involved in cell wall biosynthesis